MKKFILKVLTPVSIVYPYGTGRIGKLSIFGIPIYRAEFPEWDANLRQKRNEGLNESARRELVAAAQRAVQSQP